MTDDISREASQAEGRLPPLHAGLLARLSARVEPLVAEVAADVAEAPDAVRPAVEFMLAAIGESDRLTSRRLEELRAEGSAAATQGLPLPALLDRYLSTGWVLWGGATREPDANPAELTSLGAALLRAVDSSAAALSDGHGAAERDAAARAAAANRQFLDEVLDLRPGDAEAADRIGRRASHFGLDPWQPYAVVVVAEDRELADDDREVDELARAVARPDREGAREMARPLLGARRGRLVLIVPAAWRAARLTEAIGRVARGAPWRAVHARAERLHGVAAAYAAATDALDAAERAGRGAGELLDAGDLLLERAVFANPLLARGAFEAELGRVLEARGGAQLVATLAAYLTAGQNIHAAARALSVAPRTVTYRLERVETLLERELRGDEWLRIATALLIGRQLGAARPVPPAAAPAAPRAGRRSPAEPRTQTHDE